jgi:4-hydroxy-tetrahydrodipicolinate reductase
MATAKTVRIGIAGALGRMGRVVAETVEARDGVEIAAIYDAPGSEGQVVDDAGARVLLTREQTILLCDAVIDFTVPQATAALARLVAEKGGPALILGSTGLSESDEAAISAAAKKVAVVKSGNFSLGVNTLMGLVQEAAERLGADNWDIEIFEAHHNRKIDSPSGTALMLGRAAAKGRGVALEDVSVRARDGINGPRQAGDIGFSVMRGGGIVGEHSVTFAAEDEILTLHHSARDRSLFAKGAVRAAQWAAGRKPGLYDMMDVLGFKD